MQLAERSLATAIAAQNRDMTLKTHRALAELLMKEPGARAQALEHVDACLDLAVKLRQPHDEAVCSWVKASILHAIGSRRTRARRSFARSTRPERAHSPRTQAYSAQPRMRLSWETKPRRRPSQDSLAALDSVETLRSLQDDSDGSAEQFSTWTSDYLWLSGRLLQDAQERRRRPGVLDHRAHAGPVAARHAGTFAHAARTRRDPAVKTGAALLEAHRRGAAAPDGSGTWQTTSVEPRSTSCRISSCRNARLAGRLASPFQLDASAPPRLPAVERCSDARANEALLSFQVGLWETFEKEFGGGSWLIALTKQQQTVHRLPDRDRSSRRSCPMFTGLLARADGLDAPVGGAALRPAPRPRPCASCRPGSIG